MGRKRGSSSAVVPDRLVRGAGHNTRPARAFGCNENEYLLNAYVLDARGCFVHHDDRRLSFTPARRRLSFRRGAGKVVVICAMR